MSRLLLLQADGRRRMRRERVFRDRTRLLDSLSDRELLENYGFTRHDILYINSLVEDGLTSPTLRNHAIPSEAKTLISLRFLAKGNIYSETSDLHGISRSSHSRILHKFCLEMKKLAPKFIKFPQGDALTQTKEGFYRISGFPNTIGAVDGTQIEIMRPSANEDIYVNRKGRHSINTQAVVDSELKILNMVAKFPGSTHDSFIWNTCSLKQKLDSGAGPDGWLVGDSAYTQRPSMMTPVEDPQTRAEERYNSAQTRTRNHVERAFGVLKNRFRCIHKQGGVLPFRPERCCNLIMAIGVLHNIAKLRNTPNPPDDFPGDDANHDEGAGQRNAPAEFDLVGLQARQTLIASRFT